MAFDPQAQSLNATIKSINPAVYTMLSDKGKAIYFPKQGILAQSAEAKGKNINATIGTALEDSGLPIVLNSIDSLVKLKKTEGFSYAPSNGLPEFRTAWESMMIQKNPSLKGKKTSTPIVSCALTHGLSMAGYMFVNPEDAIIIPDRYWENYNLIYNNGYNATLETFPTFTENNEFNVQGLKEALINSKSEKKNSTPQLSQ